MRNMLVIGGVFFAGLVVGASAADFAPPASTVSLEDSRMGEFFGKAVQKG